MTDTEPEYQYHMKDHLGNVRLTFTSKQEVESAMATVEPDNMTAEKPQFIYYGEAVVVNSQIFDHTNDNAVDPEGYSMRLTGGIHHQYGLAKSLSVMPGDTVKMSVFAKYVKPTSQGTWPVDIAGLMNDLANPTTGLVVDGKLAGSIDGGVFPFLGLMQRTEDSDTLPKACLNYIVFDQRDTLVDFGYIRVNQDAYETGTNGDHQHLFYDLVIRQSGYVYIYLSNENETPVDVFFDDFKVEHVKSPVIAVDDYYPFGLTFNSYARENAVKQNYLYNRKEIQDELGLGWSGYGARMYMSDIGRWAVIDPLAAGFEQSSPYNYTLNNPVTLVDIMGLAPAYNWETKQYEENGKEVSWQDVKKAYSIEDKSENVLLMPSDMGNDPGGAVATMLDAAVNHSSVKVLQVSGTQDAANQLTEFIESGGSIGNLIVGSHGGYSKASFGIGKNLYNTAKKIQGDAGLARIQKLLTEDSQVVISACHTGSPQNGGVELLKSMALKMKTSVFGNQSWDPSNTYMFGGFFNMNSYIQNFNLLTFRAPLMLLLLVAFSSCCFTSSSKNEQLETRFYSDIDMFNLKGINEMSFLELNTPYISIDSISVDERQIVFVFDDNTKSKGIYRKKSANLWISERKLAYDGEEGSPFRYYEFVEPDQITTLEYGSSSNAEIYLSSIEILNGNKVTRYEFEPDEHRLPPTNDELSYPLDKALSKSASIFTIQNRILKYRSLHFDLPSNRLDRTDQNCYVVNNLSYFWWSRIGHKLEKVECGD